MIRNHLMMWRPVLITAAIVALLGCVWGWGSAADVDASVTPNDLSQSTKTVNVDEQKAGKTVTFELTVRYAGDETDTVLIMDTMPPNMVLLPDTVIIPDNINGGVTLDSDADAQSLMWEGLMFGGSSFVITYDAMIAETAEIGDVLINSAVINGSDGLDVIVSASVTVSKNQSGIAPVYLPMLSWAGIQGLCYQAENNVVIVDVTRQRPNGWEFVGWSDALGDGYYRWPGEGILNTAGQGLLSYKIKVDNPGRYYMRMYAMADHPSRSDESNDMWARMNGDVWHKAVTWSYQWRNWGWAAGLEIHGGAQNPPYYDLSAGVHTFDLSARSGQYRIERLAFYQSGALGFDERNAEHQFNSAVRNQIDNTLDAQPVSEFCVGYVPPYFDR